MRYIKNIKLIIAFFIYSSIFLNVPSFAEEYVNIPDIPIIQNIPSFQSNGNTYHVSKSNGVDNKLSGSFEKPFKTIQYGVNQLIAGDTLIVHEAETPYKEEVWISCAGNASNYIQIKGAEGERVVLSPPTQNAYRCRGFAFKSTSAYIYLSNFEFSGKYLSSVNLRNGCHHVIIENVNLHGGKYGIYLKGGHHIYILDSNIYNNLYRGVYLVPRSYHVIFKNVNSNDNVDDGFGGTLAITSDGRPTDPENVCKDIYFNGCSAFKNGNDGFDIGIAKNAIFKNCRSYENLGNGIKVWGAENWIINCLLYNNFYIGISPKPLWDMNIYILNNTIVNNVRMQIRTEKENTMNGVVTKLNFVNLYLYNNIIVGQENNFSKNVLLIDISKNGRIKGENHNLFYSTHDDERAFDLRKTGHVYYLFDIKNGKWEDSEVFAGANTFVANPKLINYNLISNSPAINNGVYVGINDDIIGTKRPQGNGYDIGAFEYPASHNVKNRE